MNSYFLQISIDEHSIIPKYRQLAEAIENGLETGNIDDNSRLPSLHQSCTTLNVSKRTVEKAYNFLKNKGLVISVKGKGFAIKAGCNINEMFHR